MSADVTNSGNQLKGSIESIVIRREDTGWCVLSVCPEGAKDAVRVTAVLPFVTEGASIEAVGDWHEHPTFGRQFRARNVKFAHPATAEGIYRFLSSGAVRGVGKKFARRLVNAFQAETLNVIRTDRVALEVFRGIGPKRVTALRSALREYEGRIQVMVFLAEHFGAARAARIQKRYGDDAESRIRHNPYRLIEDFDGIGFKTADALAQRLGVKVESRLRLRAAIQHVVMDAAQRGHCAIARDELIARTDKLIGVMGRAVDGQLQGLLDEKRVILDRIDGEEFFYRPQAHAAEVGVAERLMVLSKANSARPPIQTDNAVRWAERVMGLSLSQEQRDALRLELTEKIAIVTGGPGTGKTTILKALLEILAAKNIRFEQAAPTGRAARRMHEASGYEARTIHRLLGYDSKTGGFVHGPNNPLPVQVLIIDETSMVDIYLAHSLLQAVPDSAHVIFVGDKDQLPSVMGGRVLADIIDSGRLPVARLTKVYRQAAHSGIIRNAHRINQGEMPALDGFADFAFTECRGQREVQEAIVRYVSHELPALGFDPRRDVQVISPQYAGEAGVDALNDILQSVLNPHPTKVLDRGRQRFCVGDKVLQRKNNYDLDVFNGDVGFVTDIDLAAKKLFIDFDGRQVEMGLSDMDHLSHGFAITCHRSQGGEYPAVVVATDAGHSHMLDRPLVYTAVTRGKRQVAMFGQRRTVGMAVKSTKASDRVTFLAHRLQGNERQTDCKAV